MCTMFYYQHAIRVMEENGYRGNGGLLIDEKLTFWLMRTITISGRDVNFLNACSISLTEVSRERKGRSEGERGKGKDYG